MPARTPADTDHLFGERVNAGDLDGMIALYEPNATFVAADGGLRVGRDAIREELSGLMAAHPKIDMGTIRVVPLADDLAVLHHDWVAVFTEDQGQVTEMRGKATEVVRRQADGAWLFLLDDPNMRG